MENIQACSQPLAANSEPTGADLFARFALAGAVCCSTTHSALTPIDVVKTRMQLSPEVYNRGMLAAYRQILTTEGAGTLLTGLGPTAAGYFVQGGFKFGGYEFWKKYFIETVGVENAPTYRLPIYMVSSALAEFVADIALCPLEATRIRLVSQPAFASGLFSGFTRLWREEGVMRGFYSGFGPILLKQVPYNMAKFSVYEVAAEHIYNWVSTPKEQLSSSTVTAINFASGLISGVAAAIISQPADTLLSKVNKQKGAEGESIAARLITLSKELGVRGLFLGMGTRIVMVGTLTAGQFTINGDVKRMLGATSSYEIAKATQ